MIDARQTKILLVDDDRHIRIVVKDFLSAKGYEVLTARNGPEALDMLTTVKPDLVLLDIMMPGMDGGDVARIIRSDPDTEDLRIAYLTAAVTEREVQETGGIIGGERYISKSGPPHLLVEQVEACLSP